MEWNRLPKYSKKKEKKLEEELKNEKIGFKDRFAMIIAAYMVFLPPVILVLGLFVLLIVLIF